MGEAPVPLVVARYFAIVALLLVLIAPIPFTRSRYFTATDVHAVPRTRELSATLEQAPFTYNATRKHAQRHLAWPIVAMLAFAAAVGEGYAYRRAVRDQRKAGVGGSIARAVPVIAAGGFALIACWYAWGSKALEPSLGLLVAVAATAVIIGTFIRELTACHAGQRGWIDYPLPTTLPFADVVDRRQ